MDYKKPVVGSLSQGGAQDCLPTTVWSKYHFASNEGSGQCCRYTFGNDGGEFKFIVSVHFTQYMAQGSAFHHLANHYTSKMTRKVMGHSQSDSTARPNG
jgi:hypothetical protein